MNKVTMRWLNLVIILLAILIYQGVALGREVSNNQKLMSAVNSLNSEKKETAASVSAKPAEVQKNEPRLFKDGTYEGSADGFGGKIKLSVTVKNDTITDIEVTDHSGEGDAYYSQAEKLVDQIIEQQSTDLDTVSGATFSSNGILNAVSDALEKAKK